MTSFTYSSLSSTAPPPRMTMERLDELQECVVAQSAQLCCRHGFCHPSLNWIVRDADNYEPGSSPFSSPHLAGGWIHEEATFGQRCCCGSQPGSRKTKFVQHAGSPPAGMMRDEGQCCVIQCEEHSPVLTWNDLQRDIVATHSKEWTLCTGCCYYQPYLQTHDTYGVYLGETRYECDGCIFVPKFHVLDKHRQLKYILRPDTCLGGLCVMPRCGGKGGKCLRVPFLVRYPENLEAHPSHTEDGTAQVTELWSGLVNEACYKRHAYHVAFPREATAADKFTLMGASLLVDVALFEHEDNGNSG